MAMVSKKYIATQAGSFIVFICRLNASLRNNDDEITMKNWSKMCIFWSHPFQERSVSGSEVDQEV